MDKYMKGTIARLLSDREAKQIPAGEYYSRWQAEAAHNVSDKVLLRGKPLKMSLTAFVSQSSIKFSLPWLMLISRAVFFLVFQSLIALIFVVAGNTSAWDESARWWTIIATLANFVSIYLLVRLYNAEGRRFHDLFKFSRTEWKKDLLWFLGLSIIAMPIVDAPREPLANAIFGDSMIATTMLFRPLPTWAFVLSFLFPLTIAFAELPTYFAYCMPRLSKQINNWLAWIIASFFLAAQHMFLPLIFNSGYLLWRLGMFLPFALFTGLALKFRPSLLPYFLVTHALMDVATVLVYLMI